MKYNFFPFAFIIIFTTNLAFGMRNHKKRIWAFKHNNSSIEETVATETIAGFGCCFIAAACGVAALAQQYVLLPAVGAAISGTAGTGLWGDALRRNNYIDSDKLIYFNGKLNNISNKKTSKIYIEEMKVKKKFLQTLLLADYSCTTKREKNSIESLKLAFENTNNSSLFITTTSDAIADLVEGIRRKSKDKKFFLQLKKEKEIFNPIKMELTVQQNNDELHFSDIFVRAWVENYCTRLNYNVCVELDRTCEMECKKSTSKGTVLVEAQDQLPKNFRLHTD